MSTEVKTKAKTRGLGRGLNALFEDEEVSNFTPPQKQETASAPAPEQAQPRTGRLMLGIEQLTRNETQPREHFDEEALEQLSDSLKQHGMIQPITVRKRADGKYEIVAGERRWRAAQRAQMHEVPVSILDLDDRQTLEIALIENLQREDLNPVEEAQGYHRLQSEYNLTQEQISKVVGKSRSHVANVVRLLNLPPLVLGYLEEGKLSAGHARALVAAQDPEALAKKIVLEGLNVRKAEEIAGEGSNRSKTSKTGKLRKYQKDADTLALENDLSNMLGMKVIIETKNDTSGTVRIDFKSLDQLDDLIQRLSRIPRTILVD